MTNFWQKLNKPITILAPMDDVTDVVFREVIAQIAKPDIFFTEFTSADALCSKGRDKVTRKLAYTKTQRPVVAQIWGATPQNFKEAAIYIKELGFDGIDINMGCPDKGIVKKGSGSALINSRETVENLINAIRAGAPELTLSIKTRLDHTQDLTKEWLSFLLSQNINALTLHARTVADLSKVPAKWDEIGKLIELRNKINPDITVIGNGDARSYKDIVEKHNTYGVDGVMVGTGIFYDPWLFEKSENPQEHSVKEHLDLLVAHTNLFHETWGKTKNFELMKKFFKVYVKDFRGANELRQELMLIKNYEGFCRVMREQN